MTSKYIKVGEGYTLSPYLGKENMSNNRFKRTTKKPITTEAPKGQVEVIQGNVSLVQTRLLNAINANLRELINVVKEKKI